MRPERMPSPAVIVTTLAAGIFVAEVVVMAVLAALPPLPYWAEWLLDATLLMILVAPTIHFLIYRRLKQAYSALEQSNRDLQRSRREFRQIVERNSDGVLVLDADGLVRYANPAACSLLGRGPGELLGFPLGLPLGGEAELAGGGWRRSRARRSGPGGRRRASLCVTSPSPGGCGSGSRSRRSSRRWGSWRPGWPTRSTILSA